MADQPETTVWIRSWPDGDRAYALTLEAGASVVDLDSARAVEHALGVLEVAHRAAYDAAVYAQLRRRVDDQEAVGQVVADLRQQRPPLQEGRTKPLGLEPGVSLFTGEPFLTVLVDGERVGQWSLTDARSHALGVLEAVVVAELDGGYYRALRQSVGLEEAVARQVVQDVGRHRA